MKKPINVTNEGNAFSIKASYFKNTSLVTLTGGGGHYPCTGVLEWYSSEDTAPTASSEEGSSASEG